MIEAARTAVVVVDMQNDFCHPDGYYARRGLPVDLVRAGIEGVRGLLAAARSRGVPVVYTRLVHDRRVADVMERHRILPAGWVADAPRLAPGTWGARVIDELAPAAGEPVFDKGDYSAFYGTGLEPHLRRAGIRTLLLAGTVDYACVLHTALDAFCRDFDVLVCREAVSGWYPDLGQSALRIVELLAGRVVSSAAILRELDV